MTMLKVGPVEIEQHPNSPPLVEWDTKGQEKIARMYVSHGKEFVNSIQFQYIDEKDDDDPKLVLSPIIGWPDLLACYFDTVTFTDPCKEYITRVSGCIEDSFFSQEKGLKTFTIETNVATYGPFGPPDRRSRNAGTDFNYWLGPDNQFGGFHGKSTPSFIVSIGVYVRPIQHLAPVSKSSTHARDDDQLPIS